MFDTAFLAAAKAATFKAFDLLPSEVKAFRQAVIEGRIDGRLYSGKCACLYGTLGKRVAGLPYNDDFSLLPVYHNKLHEHYSENLVALKEFFYANFRHKLNQFHVEEEFFSVIHEGDTPTTSEYSALALSWVNQWMQQQDKVLVVIPAVGKVERVLEKVG